MAKYEVQIQVKVPKSRNPQTGKVTYQRSGYGTTKVIVNASSPEEARKIAGKHEKVTKAKTHAARNLDYNMPKPRVQVMDVSRVSASRGGGSMGGGSLNTPDQYSGTKKGLAGTRRQMNKGGYSKKKKKK